MGKFFKIEEEEVYISSEENYILKVLKRKEKKVSPIFGGTSKEFTDSSYIVPPEVEAIGKNCFSNATKLEKIELPPNLKSIEQGAFSDCSSLKEITIPEGVREIEYQAFQSCSSLTEITIPSSVESIAGSCFENCTSLERITLEEGVKAVYDGAFSGCSSLREIEFPESIRVIHIDHLFVQCAELKNITIPAKALRALGYYGDEPHDYTSGLKAFIRIDEKFSITIKYENFKELYDNMLKYGKLYPMYNRKIRLKLIFKGPLLNSTEKDKITELIGIENVKEALFINYNNGKKIEEEKKNIEIDDPEIKKIIDEINEICSKLNNRSKNLIIEKVNELIKEYQRNLEDLKPKFREKTKFGETKKDIRLLKPELINSLESIKLNLAREKQLLKRIEDLERYTEYLKTKITEKTKEDNTIDTIIKNIIYYCNYMPEEKKNMYIARLTQQIYTALTMANNDFEDITNDKIDLKAKSDINEELNFRMIIEKIYDEVVNYAKRVKPYKELYDQLNSEEPKNEFIESDDLISFFSNIQFVINKISNAQYKKDLNRLFIKTKEKYITLLDKIMNDNEMLKSVTYEDIGTEIRKDIHPILELINGYALLDRYEREIRKNNNLPDQIKTSIEIINGKEVDEEKYKDQLITSTIIEIINIINKEETIDSEQKKELKSELLEILNRNSSKLINNNPYNLKEYNQRALEILKEISGFKTELTVYIKELEEYNSYSK